MRSELTCRRWENWPWGDGDRGNTIFIVPSVVKGLQEELCAWSEAGRQRLGHTGPPGLWKNLGLLRGPSKIGNHHSVLDCRWTWSDLPLKRIILAAKSFLFSAGILWRPVLKEFFYILWLLCFLCIPTATNWMSIKLKMTGKNKKVEPKCLKEEAHLASATPIDSQQVIHNSSPDAALMTGNLQNRCGINKEWAPCFNDQSCYPVTTTFCVFARTFPSHLKKKKRWVLALDFFYYFHGLDKVHLYTWIAKASKC